VAGRLHERSPSRLRRPPNRLGTVWHRHRRQMKTPALRSGVWPVDTFVTAASIDPRLAPTSLGMGGDGTALLGRAGVRCT
jgi:hypothetical protein